MAYDKIFYFFLIAFFVKSTAYPLNNDDKIVFIEEEDERFNDLVDPVDILTQKVDKFSFKKFFNKSIDFVSKFDDTDSDEDFRNDETIVLDEKQLVQSKNLSREFLEDETVELKLQDGEFFQGDIMIAKGQEKFLFSDESSRDGMNLPSRTGIIDLNYRWRKSSNGFVLIPYKFWPKSRYSEKQKTMIRLAMDDIEQHTCIRFIPRSRESDFIMIYSGDDCSSFLGRAGGEQLLSLRKDGCFSRGVIIHELIHTLGYDHMQNHPERDEFVKIFWKNIKPENRFNFEKLDEEKFSNFGTPYDYYSVMHYSSTAFSRNGKRTIGPKNKEYKSIIGQRIAMSFGDVERINNMYQC